MPTKSLDDLSPFEIVKFYENLAGSIEWLMRNAESDEDKLTLCYQLQQAKNRIEQERQWALDPTGSEHRRGRPCIHR